MIPHLTMGPDPAPTRAQTVEHARPQRVASDRVQFADGHVLGRCSAQLYGRTGASAAELEAIAATALAMAAILKGEAHVDA